MLDFTVFSALTTILQYFCDSGLNGFPQAIEAVYPKTEIQQCIIHRDRFKFCVNVKN